jgi:hypothetical protein
MARLLQTLDEDGISGNGISISVQAHNQATDMVVDFSSVDFEQQVVDVVANSCAAYTSLITTQLKSVCLTSTALHLMLNFTRA